MIRNQPDPGADTVRSPDPARAVEESGAVATKESVAPGLLLSDAARPGAPEADAGSRSGGTGSAADACLSEDELLDYQSGRCSQRLLARVDAHVDLCQSCRELVYHLLHGAETPSTGTAPGAWPVTFGQGSIVNGRYEIRNFVGRGGMGEVYEAFDRLMGSRVALKTVLCTASDRPHAVRKLMEEVRNALRVGHPNVCRINELQEHLDAERGGPSLPFFTMEFIEGTRLGARLRAGPLPAREARQIALQLLDGLKAAHARGVLHLDFKSDNVMLRAGADEPEAVIMDFGLSRALDPVVRQHTSERLQLAGTLSYMSMEQLECRPGLGPAADVYSFGVVLYEMLTGQLPHRADSLSAMLLEQLKERPLAPSRRLRGLAPALDRFVLKCLETDPAKRYPDADSALGALRSVGEWDTAQPSRLQPWHLLAAVSVVAVALLLSVPGLRNAAPAGPPQAPSVAQTAQLTPARGGAAAAGEPSAQGVPARPLPDGPPPAGTRSDARRTPRAAAPEQARRAPVATPGQPAPPPPAATEDDWSRHSLPTSLLLPRAPAPAAAPDAGR